MTFALMESLQAQDIIVKQNGARLKTQLVDTTGERIRYRLYGQDNSPVFVVYWEEVRKIILENGEEIRAPQAQEPEEPKAEEPKERRPPTRQERSRSPSSKQNTPPLAKSQALFKASLGASFPLGLYGRNFEDINAGPNALQLGFAQTGATLELALELRLAQNAPFGIGLMLNGAAHSYAEDFNRFLSDNIDVFTGDSGSVLRNVTTEPHQVSQIGLYMYSRNYLGERFYCTTHFGLGFQAFAEGRVQITASTPSGSVSGPLETTDDYGGLLLFGGISPSYFPEGLSLSPSQPMGLFLDVAFSYAYMTGSSSIGEIERPLTQLQLRFGLLVPIN
jgi:hypothetical protein